MDDRIIRLEERFERLQADVTDIKTDIKRVDDQVGTLRDSVTKLQVETKDGIIALMDRMLESERAIRGEFMTAMVKLHDEQKRLPWGGLGACTFILLALAGGYSRLEDRLIDIEKRLPLTAAPETAARSPASGNSPKQSSPAGVP